MQLMRNLVLQSLNSKKLVSLASRFWLKPNPLQSVESFLRSKFIYVDEKIETLVAPEYMLQGLEMTGTLRGDCDDISTLHAALLTCMDIKTRFVAIRSTQTDPNYDHVFIEAFDGIKWIPYDITVPAGTTIEWFSRVDANV
jgi:transglutaminase superfamily protein